MTEMTPDERVEAVSEENRQLMNEIQKLMVHNTKLQRELRDLNNDRDHFVAEGHERVATLTAELKKIDKEYTSLRTKCDRMTATICEYNENMAVARKLGMGGRPAPVERIDEEDLKSDRSTASTASTASSSGGSSRGQRSRSIFGSGKPPVSSRGPKQVDVEQPRPKTLQRSMSQNPSLMTRITRSMSRQQSVPDPRAQELEENSPMLAYKAASMLRQTSAHLNNFRRHSGPYRKNRETVVL
ncbi:hypothetical protein Poli38472_003271 [Pythium oligandrum]|uniref:Uncharacterized protein n=1 Tax=Pythium oligandrum TaxID=41045 RepID=A0A8K1FCM2_PYTOL|nr:hypothetical protein Poli38472_003271 [Pythium oligandrum]|eukprot:TMW57346.1 hypothetical protein Poli38472_003271 [Pythium oligandrum]